MSNAGCLTVLFAVFAMACQSTPAASVALDAGDAGDAGDGQARSSGDAGLDAEPMACAASSDCIFFPPGPAISCCIHDACLYGDAALAEACADASTQDILASSYDQSCQTDTDCAPIAEGSFCGESLTCPNAAINKGALAQYQADLAKTPAGVCLALSSCGTAPGPCCRSGVCRMNAQCTGDGTGDASADAADADTEAGRSDAGDAGTD